MSEFQRDTYVPSEFFFCLDVINVSFLFRTFLLMIYEDGKSFGNYWLRFLSVCACITSFVGMLREKKKWEHVQRN